LRPGSDEASPVEARVIDALKAFPILKEAIDNSLKTPTAAQSLDATLLSFTD
jgi:hypothetical protein